MNEDGTANHWEFHHFGMLVTGKGEEQFLPRLARALTVDGRCSFRVIRRIGQRSPVVSEKRKLRMVGSGMSIPNLDMTEIGLPARNFLSSHASSFVLLVDDLEHDRRSIWPDVFDRYRSALDAALPPSLQKRASVHFLVNMLEAYYFAHSDAVNEALGTHIADHDGDVEEIRHPKNDLKLQVANFDESQDGAKIVALLDIERVLDNPSTCASLRTMFKWCTLVMGGPITDRFQLRTGQCSPVTGGQLLGLNDR